MAVLSFILSDAAKHSVDGKSLASELQQLGLPQRYGLWVGSWAACGPRAAREGDRPCDPKVYPALSGPGTQAQPPPATSRATPFYPQSTRPARATVMRRSKAPCRSTCRSAAYAVSMRPARVRAHSRRCTQHAKCMESPGRRLNHGHMVTSSRRAGTWPWVS